MHIEELTEKRDEDLEIEIAETPTEKLEELRDVAQEIADRAEYEIDYRNEEILDYGDFSIELKKELENGLTTGVLKFDGGSKRVVVDDFEWGLKCILQGATRKSCAGLFYNREDGRIHIAAGDGGFSISIITAEEVVDEINKVLK